TCEIASQMFEAVSLNRLRPLGRAIAALVRRNHADTSFAQGLDLMAPGEGQFRPAVAKHDRRGGGFRTRIVIAHAKPVGVGKGERRHLDHWLVLFGRAFSPAGSRWLRSLVAAPSLFLLVAAT